MIRRQSSKSLLQNPVVNESERGKSQPPIKRTPAQLINTESTAVDDKRRGGTHSLGNQQTLPMSSGPAAIFYREQTQSLKDTLGKGNCNLSLMLRNQNLLEEDGIEDLHFHFVAFN